MSAHVLLNLFNELGKRDKMRGLPSILYPFHNEFNKFNIIRTQMLDSIYHMTLNYFKISFFGENLYSGFLIKRDPNQSPQLQRLARILKFRWKPV